ncbi:MAG: hypothetical protein V4675_02680 [Verrucomicrobiota bacterium]
MSQSTLSTTPSRHFRLRMAAVLYFGARLSLLALLVAAPLAYWRMGITDWRMGAAAAGVVLLAYIFAWLAAWPVRCVVCTQPALRGSSQPKHPYAAKWLGLSYPARVAWDVLTAEYHQCMYCHSRCRNRGPSRKGLGKAAAVKTPELRPDLATLMGPAGVVAVETRMVEQAAPVSSPPAPVLAPVLESPVMAISAEPKPLASVVSALPAPLTAGPPPELDAPKPALEFLPTAPPLPSVIVPQAEEAPRTAPVPPAISPLPAAPPAFPVFDSTPTPVPAMSPPALPLPVLAFPFQTALAGQPEIGPPSEALSPAAAPAPVVMLPPALPVTAAAPPALPSLPSNPFALPPALEAPTQEKEPVSFFGAVRPPSLPAGPSPFLSPVSPKAAAPVPAPPPLEPAWPAPALPSLPVAPLPGFSLDTPTLKPAVEPAPPAPVPSQAAAPVSPMPVSTAPVAVPVLPVESVIKVLQEGRAAMELAFQSMIDQLRSTLEGAAFPPAAAVDLPEAPPVNFPPPVPEVCSGPTPPLVAAPAVVPAAAEADGPPAKPASAPLEAPVLTPVPAPPPQPVFPHYPPLYPVTPPAPEAMLPALASPVVIETPLSAAAPQPVRRRPLPAISPNLIAELDSTLAQAFSPAMAPGAPPATTSAPVPPAPLAAPSEVSPGFSLTPLAVPPGNSFAPSPPVSGPDASISPPEGPDDGAPSVPAPFSFLQAVPGTDAWPNDDLSDLAPAETPPMWTRTRGNPSLS